MEGPIFQELCSPADANCCSVFACGFNWIVHLCHCADYFALINTCRAAATTASLQPIWDKLWTWVLLRQLETGRLTWMFPTIFIPNSPPKSLVKTQKRLEALGAPPRICKACQDRRSVPKPREEEWFLVGIACTASSTHPTIALGNFPQTLHGKHLILLRQKLHQGLFPIFKVEGGPTC